MADIKVEHLHKEFGLGDDKVVALEASTWRFPATCSFRSLAPQDVANRPCSTS